ncbi:hypothetical protein P9112_013032 [Eukaryota sp. TZLM1-RC]
MRTLFVLLFVALVHQASAGCRCPNQCNWGFKGSKAECFCFCDQTAKRLGAGPDARCTFVASSSFNSGGCSICSNSIQSVASSAEALSCEVLLEQHLADGVIGNTDSINEEIIFPVRQCKCPNRCDFAYFGSYSQCHSWARGEASNFINGHYDVQYVPHNIHTRGGCSICGDTDPCKTL